MPCSRSEQLNECEKRVLKDAIAQVIDVFGDYWASLEINASKVRPNILLTLLIVTKVYIIGTLPPRQADPATPQLNKWYADFQRIIPCAPTDTAEAKADSVRAARAQGKIVIASSNDPATDGPMLRAATYGVMLGSSGDAVTAPEMIQIVLWLCSCSCATL